MNNQIVFLAESIKRQKEFVELLEETYSTDVISVVKASETFLKIAYDPNQSNKMERLAINQINETSETAIATKGRLVEQQNKLKQMVEEFQEFLRLY